MGHKGWMSLAIIAFVVFVVAVAFWTFPSIEEKLNNQALELKSVKQLEGAELEWNGRNGYLIVPADIDKSIAENAAGDIEEIQGVRKVRVIYDESLVTTVEKMPGKFNLNWTKDKKNIEGQLDDDSINKLEEIFGVNGMDTDEGYTLSGDVISSLEVLGADVFDDLTEGAIDVEGEKINLSGILSETADIDVLKAKWGSLDGVVLDLTEPEVAEKTEEAQSAEEEAQQVQTEINAMLEFDNVLFTKNSSIIIKDSRELVESIAQVLLEHEDVEVDIVGHTDSYGEAEWNMELSKARANAVMEMLIKNGVDASRMTAIGKGEDMPIETNKTIEGRQANRRVEILVRGNS